MARGPNPAPPPATLAARPLPLLEVPGPWFRIHAAPRAPLHFGRARAFRFDAPDGAYGVLYAGADEACAFVETFLRVPRAAEAVSRADLATRSLSRVKSSRPLRLVDLTEHRLAQLRVDAGLFASTEYRATQAWSRAFHEHPARPDGLWFHSRHDPGLRAVALFERCKGALRAERVHPSLLDAAFARTLGAILDRYAVALL